MIEDLIAECTAYDYKEMLEKNRPKSWLKSVSAFANTLGGSLLFGVEKNDAVDDAEFKGNILLLLRESMAFVKATTRKGWEKLPMAGRTSPSMQRGLCWRLW